MKKIRKKRPEKNKERNQLRPLQTTRNQIAVFVSDWLIRLSANILANHRLRSWKSLEILDLFLGSIKFINSIEYEK